MLKYITNVDKLSTAASTQANESFNNTMISFCPKSKHFSSSESFNFRVAAAVCQKNIGFDYVDKVYELLGVSPIKSNSLRNQKEVKKCVKRLYEGSVEYKTKKKNKQTKEKVAGE